MDTEELMGGDEVYTSKAADEILGHKFLPLFNINRAKFPQKQRLVEDPEWLVSAATFGWPKPDEWGVALYSPEGEYKSLAKYYTTQRFAPDDWAWKYSYDYMNELWAPYVANTTVATHEEAIWAMDGTKACGPPFFEYKDTYLWLEGEGWKLKLSWENPELSWLNLWNCKVKEELRPAEKLALNKVRTFTASNKAYQYMFSRLFWRQNDAIIRGCGTKAGHTVGMSKYQAKWTELGNYLDVHPNKFDYDVATCDGEVQNHEKEDYLFFKWDNLRKEDRTEHNYRVFQRVILTELFSFVVDAYGTVWLVPCGTKSGSPDTAISTTWIVKRRFVYGYFKLMGFDRPGVYREAKQSFEENVRHLGQGDDGVFSVSDAAVENFNYVKLKELFEKCGWHLETLSVLPRDLDSVVFLSNWFRKFENWWLPVPATDKALASMAHTRKKTPAMALARAFALYQECFYSDEIRGRLALHIARLRKKYEKTQKDNEEWQLAMTALKSDSVIERLYLDPSVSDELDTDNLEGLN